ncbi:hypothetical protein DYB25_012450 [Aphanomyces astaci]|uniref:Uncharacterized protein n=1 Tax=Aphanomyces astaci TaxID=112090 RepID=A0A397BWJ1_APHAT|nr:hypothetical protein DYB25_012450 [Aphanomyces astaci]RHY90068.1 hypothetical protein DYB31_013644 [Aphanomyces astaci]RHZ42909.1 hypothetical protein DYB26_001402 [Aphanomyces astaci]
MAGMLLPFWFISNMKKFAKKGIAAAAAVNDDTLEQNWAIESVEVDNDTSEVEVEDEEEVDEDGALEVVDETAASKKRARDTAAGNDEEGAAAKPSKAVKKQKTLKGLQNMTQAEHFKLINDVYSKLYGDNLTPLEIANGLTEAHFTVVPQFGKHNLDSLSRFLRSICPKWKLLFKGKGIKDQCSPILLIVCSSALRAVEVGKAIAVFHCHVAKLFGKHLKLTEQVDMLKHFHPIAIGTEEMSSACSSWQYVGTPGRIKTLLEMKALSLAHTTHVVVDMHRDSKQMSILELKDTAKDTIDVLREHLLVPLASQKLSIALY